MTTPLSSAFRKTEVFRGDVPNAAAFLPRFLFFADFSMPLPSTGFGKVREWPPTHWMGLPARPAAVKWFASKPPEKPPPHGLMSAEAASPFGSMQMNSMRSQSVRRIQSPIQTRRYHRRRGRKSPFLKSGESRSGQSGKASDSQTVGVRSWPCLGFQREAADHGPQDCRWRHMRLPAFQFWAVCLVSSTTP